LRPGRPVRASQNKSLTICVRKGSDLGFASCTGFESHIHVAFVILSEAKDPWLHASGWTQRSFVAGSSG